MCIMSEIKDDPREVLVLLNSLGFVGITAAQLKAFMKVIRPWRLQPQAQKIINKKCDPVALYQKYQQEWKQISFPGEAKHSKVRWAVREKMLGTDPHPMPLLRKSTSTSMLKGKW
ncbi:hypothetical protein EAG_02984 [Camponotus floridanus]|uniref:Centriolar and ciliogenesis-associated protein HYLS1 C-terminal domain-containing protein n=1 Tax=Camponotus floridanus TaxID=104421 RepID=E2AUE6_CAMFO|nr:hypothetical protein EAG_02984 [Camponotus floridanus]